MRILFDIFASKYFKILIGIIFLQQTLVALGTYFLGKLSNDLPSEGFRLDIALALFICIILPGTLIHYLLAFYTVKTEKFSQLNYLTQYAKNHFNHPTQFRCQDSKEKTHNIMCRSGQDTINQTVIFISDAIATALNVLFNTISIALVTDFGFGLIILATGALSTVIIHLAENKISKSSRAEIFADTKLNEHLITSWDNIILGNKHFFERWKARFHQLFESSKAASIDVVKKRDLPVTLAGFLTNGLILGSALAIAWYNRSNLGFVMSLLVMLPRSLQIVMHIQIVQTYFAQWKNLKEKLIVTQESLNNHFNGDVNHYINESKILLNHQPINTNELVNTLSELNVGRLMISGENGVGKSSLMLLLKQKLGLLSAYLPANHNLILTDSHTKLSTGEIALKALEEIQHDDCKVLLLDEWDANLSTENTIKIDQILNTLSLKKIIVEVRHQHKT